MWRLFVFSSPQRFLGDFCMHVLRQPENWNDFDNQHFNSPNLINMFFCKNPKNTYSQRWVIGPHVMWTFFLTETPCIASQVFQFNHAYTWYYLIVNELARLTSYRLVILMLERNDNVLYLNGYEKYH